MERKMALDQPLIVAAYLHGDPSRKRRVKVPPNIKWAEFLALFYSRLELSPNHEIEIFDEKGIEIVSVEDLVEGDVLVVKEKWPKHQRTHEPKPRKTESSMFTRSDSHSVVSMPARVSHDLRRMSHDPNQVSSAPFGSSGLSHFIQRNSFGYYFLAEVENVQVQSEPGRVRKTHCVIKVPLRQRETGTLQTFEIEATLLRRISNHKCIVSAPTVQVLNFSDRHLQTFYKSLPQGKQELVQDLFLKTGCLESYMYPLYGVTMATKIRTGLSPDKVIKYSYQLADVMHFLQQRGVIHLNLLPENIQVMSNDRLILCNFETAIQTDPTTCLLIASHSIVAPSNKKGLAPEVVSTLSRLRLETETVDYSTQYPWSFGILSVIMATGRHPLKDYPEAFESAFRVKYRSHHFQAQPDPEQYPPLFCKLVKKSLSCDPIRRPTLPQIFTIIKKDTKIISVMSKGQSGQPLVTAEKVEDGNVVAPSQSRGAFDPIPGNEQAVRSGSSLSHREFHETHPPPSFGFTRAPPDNSPRDHMTQHKSHDHVNSRVYNSPYQSHDQSHDPYLFSTTMEPSTTRSHAETSNQIRDQFHTSTRSHSNVSTVNRGWDNFSDGQNTPSKVESNPLSARGRLALRREGLGAFSDNFVSPQLSRESSGHSVKGAGPASSRSQDGGGHGTKNSGSDSGETHEVSYQRLVPSPTTGSRHSSDEHSSPTLRVSDQERLVRASSPEHEERLQRKGRHSEESGAEGFSASPKKKSSETTASQRVLRSYSYRKATVDGEMATEFPLVVRRCRSDEPSKEERMDTAVINESNGATAMDPMLLSAQSRDHHMTISQEYELPQSHDVHMRTQSEGSPSSGAEGILMSNTTETQTTNTSFNLTSQSQGASLRDSPENMDVQSAGAVGGNLSNNRGLLSPVFSGSNQEPLVSNKQFWASVMGKGGGNPSSQPGHYLFSLDDVSFPAVDPGGNPTLLGDPLSSVLPTSPNNDGPLFPQAFSDHDLLRNLTVSSASEVNTSSQIPRADEDLTPKDGDDVMREIPPPVLGSGELPQHNVNVSNSSLGLSSRVQSSLSMSADQSTNVTSTHIEHSDLPFESTPRIYGTMSPIPEASQELTSSMSQPNSHPHRLSEVQFRSVSPISEQTNSSDAHQSVSPRPHLTRTTESERPSSQQSGVSEQESSVVTALNVGGSLQTGQTGLTGSESGRTGSRSEGGENTTVTQVEAGTTAARGERGGRSESGADHVTSNYESTASSARAEMGEANEAQTITPTPSRSADTTPTLGGEPASLTHHSTSPPSHSSSESVNRNQMAFRGKSPHSTTSAPASFPLSVPRPPRTSESGGQRSLSPLATTVRRSTEMLNTVGRTESRHAPGAGSSVRPIEYGNGAQASGMDQRPDSGLDMASRPRGGSRFRYSQQRITDYPRSQQKISQDLEMMNLAISGMDHSVLFRSQRSEPVLPRDGRSPTGHTQRHSSSIPQRYRGGGQSDRSGHTAVHRQQQPGNEARTGHAQRHTRGLQFPSNEQPSGHAQRHARTRNDLDTARMLRPITPALQGNLRSASAPSGRDTPSTPLQSSQPSHAMVPAPPQVGADSYDYLPPYSPPRPREEEATHQRHASEPGLLAEPPPSYDEIFGGRGSRDGNRRRRRNERSRFTRRAQSYRDTLDEPTGDAESSQASSRPSSRQSNSRRLISFTNLFKRARRNSNSEHVASVTDSPSATQTGEVRAQSVSGPQDLNEFTADWVASYSRTPRPYIVSRPENLTVRSTGSASAAYSTNTHTLVTRAHSDTSSVRSTPPVSQTRSQNPVPYRQPPPFPSMEDINQPSPGTVSGSYPGPPPQHRSSQSLNTLSPTSTRLPVRTRDNSSGGNRAGHAIPQPRVPHARPRPSSAYISNDGYTGHAQETSAGSADSTPGIRTRHLVGAGAGISSSCFNLSPQSQPPQNQSPQSQPPPRSSTSHATHTSTAHTSQPSLAHHTSTPATNAATSRIRAPRIGRDTRVQSSNRGQGSTVSLNQRRAASNLSINANTNSVNVTASPRASLTASPVGINSPNRVDSPIAFNLSHTPSRPSQNSVSNLIGSNSQDVYDATLTPPMASSQTTVVDVGDGVTGEGVQEESVRECDSREANGCVGGGVDVREGSGRNAMRIRAENRRMREQGEMSSDEDQHSSQMSNLSQSSQRSRVKRRRQRRSMGSSSTLDTQRSNSQLNTHGGDRSNNPSRISMTQEQSHDRDVQSPDRSPGHRSASRDNLRMSRVTEERETQSIEVTIEGVADDTTLVSLRSKSCGHPCDSGDQVMCCLCTVEQRAAAFPGSQRNVLDVINSCQFCQRRERNTSNESSASFSNKHTTRVHTNEAVVNRNRTGKSCSIM